MFARNASRLEFGRQRAVGSQEVDRVGGKSQGGEFVAREPHPFQFGSGIDPQRGFVAVAGLVIEGFRQGEPVAHNLRALGDDHVVRRVDGRFVYLHVEESTARSRTLGVVAEGKGIFGGALHILDHTRLGVAAAVGLLAFEAPGQAMVFPVEKVVAYRVGGSFGKVEFAVGGKYLDLAVGHHFVQARVESYGSQGVGHGAGDAGRGDFAASHVEVGRARVVGGVECRRHRVAGQYEHMVLTAGEVEGFGDRCRGIVVADESFAAVNARLHGVVDARVDRPRDNGHVVRDTHAQSHRAFAQCHILLFTGGKEEQEEERTSQISLYIVSHIIRLQGLTIRLWCLVHRSP